MDSTDTVIEQETTRTAGEAGWRVSRYNVSARVPDTKKTAIVNLFKGVCSEYTPLEMYLLSVVEELSETHPIIERFAKRGVITKIDERATLDSMARVACAYPETVGLTICPTMGCNFDCPYCFENHGSGLMTQEVQDDVVALAERMLDASNAKNLHVSWFGGEPLMAPHIIESMSQRLMALSEARNVSYSASIVTNGYLLTQDVADMLGRVKVEKAQITLDGLGATHDATRYLRGGGPTFEKIVSNLRNCKIPFRVNVRNNVHEGNRSEAAQLEAYVKQLSEESGNKLMYYPTPVLDSHTANERGSQVGLLCGSDASDISVTREALRFRQGHGVVCGAHVLWDLGIDSQGRLNKCWESLDKPELAFGTARDWNPRDPIATATNPDNLTCFLNTAAPVPDDECRECVWLPMCAGGCPYKRLFEKKRCNGFRNNPEAYVLALRDRISR